MKKIVLLCFLLFVVSHLMAQDATKRDTLLGRLYNFPLPDQTFKMPNIGKLNPKDSLLNQLYNFKFPGTDSPQGFKAIAIPNTNIVYSPVDHMTIVGLSYRSHMPVYKLPRSTDKMPGSNPPNLLQTPSATQK